MQWWEVEQCYDGFQCQGIRCYVTTIKSYYEHVCVYQYSSAEASKTPRVTVAIRSRIWIQMIHTLVVIDKCKRHYNHYMAYAVVKKAVREE